MEAQALAVALTPPDNEARLAPFAAVLAAEGFTVASLGPAGRGHLGAGPTGILLLRPDGGGWRYPGDAAPLAAQ
jgi:hypothetical protein